MLVLRSVECNKDDKCVLTVVVTGVCTAPCSEDNERAGGVVMRVSRPRCSSHDTQHMPGRVGPITSGMPVLELTPICGKLSSGLFIIVPVVTFNKLIRRPDYQFVTHGEPASSSPWLTPPNFPLELIRWSSPVTRSDQDPPNKASIWKELEPQQSHTGRLDWASQAARPGFVRLWNIGKYFLVLITPTNTPSTTPCQGIILHISFIWRPNPHSKHSQHTPS